MARRRRIFLKIDGKEEWSEVGVGEVGRRSVSSGVRWGAGRGGKEE